LARHSRLTAIAGAGALALAAAVSAVAATLPPESSTVAVREMTVSQQVRNTLADRRDAYLLSQQRAADARKTTAQRQAAAQQAAASAPSGSPRQIAEQMLGQFGWSGSQSSCLDPLWEHESGWNVTASNAGSGAYGIPQSLPGSKMASAGPGWQTDAATQIRWGLKYILSTYGSPCAAWSHEEASGWY
jgi:hypothetical protein